MGVYALESFVEKRCPDAIYPVDIRNLAAKALQSRKDSDKKPVIIVDLLACVRTIYGDLDLICGGQGRVYQKRWEIFVNAFESTGIELVFVKDGSSSPESKRQTKNERQYQGLTNFVYPVFDALAVGKDPDLKTSSCTLPSLMVEEIITEILKKQVLLSPRDKEGDQMIAELADDSTIGILTQDSDFLIYQYPKHVHYLSVKKFNFTALFKDCQTLETFAYDRSKLAEHLNNAAKRIGGIQEQVFEVGHLPIFATLSGNDHIHYGSEELGEFHARIKNEQSQQKWVDHHKTMAHVANFILAEEIPPEPIDPWPLGKIAELMYGDRRRREELNASISGYFLVNPESKGLKPTKKNWSDELKPSKSNPDPIEENWKKLASLQLKGGQIHSLMSGDCYKLANVLQDFRNQEIPSRAKLLEKFCQRLYGVLFDERPLVNGIQRPVVEWCMTGMGSLDFPVEQRIEKAPEFHPGLERLWCTEDKTVDDIRWRLFAYIVSPTLDHEQLKHLKDSSFIYPVCQLFILQHESSQPVLFKWEVEAFLLEHLRFQKLTEEDFDESARRKVIPHPRGVYLATLYTHGKLDLASKVVGSIVPISKLMPLNSSFDGIHFQELYKRFRTHRSIESEASREEINLIRTYFDIVTSSGTKVRREEFSSSRN